MAKLLVESLARLSPNSVIANAMGEFMQTDVSAAVAVLLQLEQIFLTARGQASAHAARALIASQPVVFLERFAFIVTPFGKVGGDLVAANDVQFGAGRGQVGEYRRLIAQQHGEPSTSG